MILSSVLLTVLTITTDLTGILTIVIIDLTEELIHIEGTEQPLPQGGVILLDEEA